MLESRPWAIARLGLLLVRAIELLGRKNPMVGLALPNRG